MSLRLTNHGNPWTTHVGPGLNEIALYTLADILGLTEPVTRRQT